jgi:hypothetical protein
VLTVVPSQLLTPRIARVAFLASQRQRSTLCEDGRQRRWALIFSAWLVQCSKGRQRRARLR